MQECLEQFQIKTCYTQGPENTCGFIAILNLLEHYSMPIPPIKKLKYIARKYKLHYGTSPADLYCISNDLGINLASIKNDKEIIVTFLNHYPILTSCHIKRKCYDIYDNIKNIPIILGVKPIQCLSFNNNIKQILVNYTECHSFVIKHYDEDSDMFLCLNIFGDVYWMKYDDWLYSNWDTTYIATKEPIKITGLNT